MYKIALCDKQSRADLCDKQSKADLCDKQSKADLCDKQSRLTPGRWKLDHHAGVPGSKDRDELFVREGTCSFQELRMVPGGLLEALRDRRLLLPEEVPLSVESCNQGGIASCTWHG